ncbi:MAG: biopolymer transporter ExbD [Deltaproteobacteria bacterium]|nr:biopolymer transporter ExbD [Deltaproteobacteria bacterium]
MSFGGGGHRSPLGGAFGKESATSYEVYLNLTPLMDVMSNILFFLLAAFGSTLIAVLPTTIPTRGDTSFAAPIPEEEKVNITVRADATGLTLKCDSPNIDPSKLKEYSSRFGVKGDEYDYENFTAALKRIKEKYPESRTMILVPDDGFRFEKVVKIMDAAREQRLPDGRKIMLFDEVVLSSTPASEKVK